MSMTDWAKREVEIACKRERGDKNESEWDYMCTCYESALKAFESLMEDEHSGCGLGITKQILIRLIEEKPLTPIDDTDDIWNKISSEEYQCTRMISLFKKVHSDGTVSYSDSNRIVCVDADNPKVPYHNGFVAKLINKMYPITMPYAPENKPIKVHCRELLTNRKNGDFDTMAILYAELPNGGTVTIERYFKESVGGWEEISKDEWQERVVMDFQRKQKENNNDSEKTDRKR